MSPIEVSALIFLCIFAGALAGMWLRSILPPHHLSDETKDLVKLGTGLIGTMSALLLGLLLWLQPRVLTMHAAPSLPSWPPTLSCSTAPSLTTDRRPRRYAALLRSQLLG